MAHRLDGRNVIAELSNGTLTAKYLRGMNLISRTDSSRTTYYLFNAHGDVVDLANSSGSSVKSYDYDAFGNEKSPSTSDRNPFRYCGEYWDTETGTYYLRARYYDPLIGRFTQQDSHWTSANAIYGDNPNQLAQREDALGLTSYTYFPQISCILQSGNLYVYCINNPILFADQNGNLAELVLLGAATSVGADYALQVYANYQAGYSGLDAWWNRINKGSLVSSAVSGGLVVAPSSAAIKAIDIFGAPLLEELTNALIDDDYHWDTMRYVENSSSNLVFEIISPVMTADIPQNIRDIKPGVIEHNRSSSTPIRGTHMLNSELARQQSNAVIRNAATSQGASRPIKRGIQSYTRIHVNTPPIRSTYKTIYTQEVM